MKVPSFLTGSLNSKNPVHGIIIIAGDCKQTVDERLQEAARILRLGTSEDAPCHEVLRLYGVTRPGDQKGHEQ